MISITHLKYFIKSIIRKIFPEKLRHFIWEIIPKVEVYNTYVLERSKPIEDLFTIDLKYSIREININDSDKLINIYGLDAFDMNILPRLKTNTWIGLAVFDTSNDNIAYVSWVIVKNTPFINEFKITLKENQYFLRHGYCVPDYRHQGLHTRMEQERINYCIRNGANEIFIQIGSKNKKGINSVENNGYVFYQKNYILRIPKFGVYRELYSALKNPFKKVI